MSENRRIKRNKDSDLLKIQILADYYQASFGFIGSIISGAVIGLFVVGITLRLENVISSIVYYGILVLMALFFLIYGIIAYRSYHSDLKKIDNLFIRVQNGETLPSITELRKMKKTEKKALAQPKLHLKPSLTSKPAIIFLGLGVLAFVFGFIARFFDVPLFPRIPEEIFLLILCSLTVILTYIAKDTRPESSFILPMFTGALIGAIFNKFLSLEFLSKPLIISGVIESAIVVIALIAILLMRRKKSLYENLRYVFLGVSLISLLSAFWVFINLIEVYLPLFPAHESGLTWFLPFDFSLVINIFKSLFLTGLFSFLERFLRIAEEAKPK